MKNGKLPGYNRIGKRDSPGTFPGVPLKRLRKPKCPVDGHCSVFSYSLFVRSQA
jgi:hypothetical protein